MICSMSPAMPSMLGKATGADSERAKPTHPAIIGISASQQRVRLLHNQAIQALAPFGERAEDPALLGPLAPVAPVLTARIPCVLCSQPAF